jgi:hypothetical protein
MGSAVPPSKPERILNYTPNTKRAIKAYGREHCLAAARASKAGNGAASIANGGAGVSVGPNIKTTRQADAAITAGLAILAEVSVTLPTQEQINAIVAEMARSLGDVNVCVSEVMLTIDARFPGIAEEEFSAVRLSVAQSVEHVVHAGIERIWA